MTRMLRTLVVGALFVATACTSTEPLAPVFTTQPSFQLAPADGNGNKVVIPVDLQFPDYVTCGSGETLDMHLVGFVQVIEFTQPHSHYFLLHQLHLVFTYSNDVGKTFVWREIGWDHLYVAENGDIMDDVAGRNGFDGIIGRLVWNVDTGEITFEAGHHVGTSDSQACGALT